MSDQVSMFAHLIPAITYSSWHQGKAMVMGFLANDAEADSFLVVRPDGLTGFIPADKVKFEVDFSSTGFRDRLAEILHHIGKTQGYREMEINSDQLAEEIEDALYAGRGA